MNVNLTSDSLFVQKVENLPDDFIFGMDASCVPALEASGVTYTDFDGQVKDVYEILSANGINYIRVRIWNDPFTADGKGYGGGNCDPANAIEVGKRATYGKKVMVAETSYAFTAEDSDHYGNTIGDGGGIVKDYPFTLQGQVHTSDQHEWFLQFKEARINGDVSNQYYDYYSCATTAEKQNGISYGKIAGVDCRYECNFSGSMPELNYDNPAVRQAVLDVARYYRDLGVDGFRFDAVKYIFFGDTARSVDF